MCAVIHGDRLRLEHKDTRPQSVYTEGKRHVLRAVKPTEVVVAPRVRAAVHNVLVLAALALGVVGAVLGVREVLDVIMRWGVGARDGGGSPADLPVRGVRHVAVVAVDERNDGWTE